MIINVSNVERSSVFYKAMFEYFGYVLADSSYEKEYSYEDWKRWDIETPHEICICQADQALQEKEYCRGAVGHHDHIAFCAVDREDIDRFHRDVLLPLEHEGHCRIEDPPNDHPEYGEGYYATYFFDPDGLKYEFVLNPNHLLKMKQRKAEQERAGHQVNPNPGA